MSARVVQHLSTYAATQRRARPGNLLEARRREKNSQVGSVDAVALDAVDGRQIGTEQKAFSEYHSSSPSMITENINNISDITNAISNIDVINSNIPAHAPASPQDILLYLRLGTQVSHVVLCHRNVVPCHRNVVPCHRNVVHFFIRNRRSRGSNE